MAKRTAKKETAREIKVKPWPKKGECARFDDLCEPICKAIQFAYDMKRRNKNRSIPYRGLDIGPSIQGQADSVTQRLRASNLRYDEEDQGRDALRVLVGLAVQLGIEQGKRHTGTQVIGMNMSMMAIYSEYMYGTVLDLMNRFDRLSPEQKREWKRIERQKWRKAKRFMEKKEKDATRTALPEKAETK